jgi:AcrR family transcriptional regulator
MALSDIVNTLCYNSTMTNVSIKSSQNRARPFAQAVPSASTVLKARKQQVVREALRASAEKLFLTNGFDDTTVEQIALNAGVSRRTFFRYFESKEDVMAERSDRLGELLLTELAARPVNEPPLLAIRNALVLAIKSSMDDQDLIRYVIRVLRETSSLRRAIMERRNRIEERICALMVHRLGSADNDNTPMLLAFITRALHDTAFNAWYDHETNNIEGLVDDLVSSLCGIVAELPSEFTSYRK